MLIHSPFDAALSLGVPIPGGYRPLSGMRVIIFIGLTGAGKTSAARHLQSELGAHLLPDRRDLTDLAILPRYAKGPVTDRKERFRLTARFREDCPGGMAEILASLSLHPDLAAPLFLFDNLRGRNEIIHAATHLPAAHFILTDAAPDIRLERLLTRGDSFDRAIDDGHDLVRRLAAFAGTDAARRLLDNGQYDPAQLSEKLGILEKEADSYPITEMVKVLEDNLPDRLTVYRSDRMSPADLLPRVRTLLA